MSHRAPKAGKGTDWAKPLIEKWQRDPAFKQQMHANYKKALADNGFNKLTPAQLAFIGLVNWQGTTASDDDNIARAADHYVEHGSGPGSW
jgi:hypothetical protein